jgi:hypothetical protein
MWPFTGKVQWLLKFKVNDSVGLRVPYRYFSLKAAII